MEDKVEINEVMTDGVIAVERDKTVKEAAELLEEEHIRGLVVVENDEAVGVIVCRDIVYEVVRKGLDPEDVRVEEVMSTDLIVSEHDEYLDEVAMAMTKNDVSRIPVVDGEMLIGIVTQSDILRAWPGYAEIMEEEIERETGPRPDERSDDNMPEGYDSDLQD